jgi:hypothetical protein
MKKFLSPGFFYAYTILIPLIYVYFGLKKKNDILLGCGLILIAVSVATIRYYHAIMPLDIALILSGVMLLIICRLAYLYLKTPRHGIKYEKNEGEDPWLSKDVEAMVIAQALAQQHAPVHQKHNTGFGEGKFGGGGAGENF